MAIQFEDYSAQIMASLDDACIAFLHEMAGEIEAQTKRNVPPGRTYYPQYLLHRYYSCKRRFENLLDTRNGEKDS